MLNLPRNRAVFRIAALTGLAFALAFGGRATFALAPRLVKDINPNPPAPDIRYPSYFFDFNGVALFTAQDGLWRSDGTIAGTVKLKSLYLPTFTSVPSQPFPWWTILNGQLFFVADDGTHGRELWKTDGTPEGTLMVKDINPGSANSLNWIDAATPRSPSAKGFTVLGTTLFFLANDGTHGRELWKTDGTEAGTVLVKDIRPGSASSVVSDHLQTANGLVFLIASDGPHGYELWKSDGTSEGTQMVKDIVPGVTSSFPPNPVASTANNWGFMECQDRLYFVAQDGTHGYELWKSDGSADGTTLVADIYPGTSSAFNNSPSSPVPMLPDGHGSLYFAANDGTHGAELWKTDGAPEGTRLVKDIITGSASSAPIDLLRFGDRVAFIADPTSGIGIRSLWVTNGTDSGTVRLSQIVAYAEYPAMKVVSDTLFFVGLDIRGAELWRTDGTPAGTRIVKDLRPGASDSFYEFYGTYTEFDPSFTEFDGSLLFVAQVDHNCTQLYRTDGTAEGTFQVSRRAGTYYIDPLISLAAIGQTVFLSAEGTQPAINLSTSGVGLWVSDGTANGTRRWVENAIHLNLGNSSAPGPFFELNGTAIFSADDGSNGRELWRTDGTAPNTGLLREIRPGPLASYPQGYARLGEICLFEANDGTHGYELWRSDGSPDGTSLLKDINPGPGHGMPLSVADRTTDLALYNGKVYFLATDGQHGLGLWVSDGLADGTTQVAVVAPGLVGPAPSWIGFAVCNGLLFFSTDTADITGQLWRTDGTPGGTFALPAQSAQYLTPLDGLLIFSAYDSTHGQELWGTDGTPQGTALVADIHTSSSSNPLYLTQINGFVLFTAEYVSISKYVWGTFVTDGTPEGTVLLSQDGYGGSSFVGVGGRALYNRALIPSTPGIRRTDGTPQGTGFLDLGSPAPEDMEWPVAMLDRAVFGANTSGLEDIWVSDATPAGTKLLTSNGSYPKPTLFPNFTLLGHTLLFCGKDSQSGDELWALDLDPDNDGLLAFSDNCPDIANPDQADADGDGVGDLCDACPNTIPGSPVDATGCPPAIRGDFDRDGDVDSADLQAFLACFQGPAVTLDPACADEDLDPDGDVDESDFGIFQRCFSGTNKPADPGCG